MSPSSRKLFGFLVLLVSALEICQARVFVLSGASNGTEFESAQFYRKGIYQYGTRLTKPLTEVMFQAKTFRKPLNHSAVY